MPQTKPMSWIIPMFIISFSIMMMTIMMTFIPSKKLITKKSSHMYKPKYPKWYDEPDYQKWWNDNIFTV